MRTIVNVGCIFAYVSDRRRIMALSSRGRMTSILAAAVLLVQSIVSLPGACGCASELVAVAQSCCQQAAVASPNSPVSQEQAAATSCCASGPCGCESTTGDRLGKCQCGDDDTNTPAAPADSSKPKPRNVDFGFQVPHLAVHSAVLSSQRDASRVPTRDTSTVESVQALLCIWRI